MQRILLLLVLFSMSKMAFSQSDFGSVKVQVFDENGEPFLGANVKLLQDDVFIKGNCTDPFGVANVIGLQSGEYILEVSGIGYSTERRELKIYNGHESNLEVNMREADSSFLTECFSPGRVPILFDAYGSSTVFKTEQILRMPVNR